MEIYVKWEFFLRCLQMWSFIVLRIKESPVYFQYLRRDKDLVFITSPKYVISYIKWKKSENE